MKKIYFLSSLLILFTTQTVYTQSDFNIKIQQIENPYYSSENYLEGLIIVEYTPGNSGAYLSLGAEWSDFSGPFDIILENLYLPSESEVDTNRYTLTASYNLYDLGVTEELIKQMNSSQSSIEFIVYIHCLSTIGFYPFAPHTFQGQLLVLLTLSYYDAVGALFLFDLATKLASVQPVTQPPEDPKTDFLLRTKVYNIDLDNETNPGSPTGYAGDLNACVPTATANSMQWLEDQKKIEFKGDAEYLKNSPGNKLATLSKNMNREHQKGVRPEPMIKGKLDFIEETKIPLSVKFQTKYLDTNVTSSNGNATAQNFNRPDKPWPDWNFIKQMLKDGEDVEMNYHWQDADSNWHAHSVNVIGFEEYQSGKKTITFSHDRIQSRKNGKNGDDDWGTFRETHEISIDDEGAMRFGHNNSRRVFLAAAESPRPSEGEATAAFLNEFFALDGNLIKNKSNQITADNEFIEIGLGPNIQELELYTILFYDGSDGTVYSEISLSEFDVASVEDSIQLYLYTFNEDHFLSQSGGIAINYSGTLIPGQFFSYGGEFTATEGSAMSLASNDLGELTEGQSIGLQGSGTNYTHFTYGYSSNPSPGELNDGQIITNLDVNDDLLPTKFELSNNYPNPFNPTTTIEFQIPIRTQVKLTIYDILGREVSKLVDSELSAGKYEFIFDAANLPSGLYLYRLSAEGFTQAKKLLLLK